jgi:rubrerythrin
MREKEGLIKIFEYALNQEKTGMSFFRTSLERMGIGAAVTAFKRLIEEEKRHIEFIERILADLKRGEDIEPKTVHEVGFDHANYFDERAASEFLQQCVEGSMIPDVTVFNTAWLIEKDLSEFYERMAEKTEGEAQQALRLLAEWEHEHERFFRQYRDRLSDVYSTMPWGG